MASPKMVVPASELNADNLIALLAEAEIPAEHGPDGMDNVKVNMGGLTLLIDPYPQQSLFKIWMAEELDPQAVEFTMATQSANAFNQYFLIVRNFVFQDPEDPSNYRAVWDHDRVVGEDGLTSAELAMTLTRVSDVLLEALARMQATSDQPVQ